MFENLSDKLESVFKKLKGHGKLTESNIEEGLREVRLALLEADVHFRVVKKFIADIKERALGQDVLTSLTPGQQIIKIVNEQLTELMGSRHEQLNLKGPRPAAVMLVGLQGSGKTTTAGKLAVHLRDIGHKPFLVPADVYRPAAIDQLTKLGAQLSVPVYASQADMDPVDICLEARVAAQMAGCDVLLLDTAGRLHVDEALMAEMKAVAGVSDPAEVLLVVDSLTGQDAVNVAQSFTDEVPLTGVVLTRMDGDARGGAALSMRAVTGKPIKFAGTGEKLDAIERFHPARVADRILGMGDVVSLVEKAAETIKAEEAEELANRMMKGKFDLNDLRKQLQQMQNMGGLGMLAGMMPGMKKAKAAMAGANMDDKVLVHMDAIIGSMTAKERANPALLNAKRKKRVAAGSGTSVQEVNKILKMHQEMGRAMKQIRKMGGLKGLAAMFGGGGLPGMGGGGSPTGAPGLPGGAGMPGLPGGELPPEMQDFLKKK